MIPSGTLAPAPLLMRLACTCHELRTSLKLKQLTVVGMKHQAGSAESASILHSLAARLILSDGCRSARPRTPPPFRLSHASFARTAQTLEQPPAEFKISIEPQGAGLIRIKFADQAGGTRYCSRHACATRLPCVCCQGNIHAYNEVEFDSHTSIPSTSPHVSSASTAPYRWPKVVVKQDSSRLHELNTNIVCLSWSTACNHAKLGAAANTPPYNPPAVFEAIRLPDYDIAGVISDHLCNEAVELNDLRAPELSTAIPPEPLPHPPAQPSAQLSASPNKSSPNAGVYRRRAEKRLETKQREGFAPRRDTVMPQLLKTAAVHEAPVNVANFPVDSSGWMAVNEPVGMQRSGRPSAAEAPKTVQEYLDAGFSIHKWNGRDPCLLADVNGHVFADLVGRPDDPGYLAAAKRVHDLMAKKSAGVVWTAKETDTHRGVHSINEGWFWSKEQRRLFWLCGGQKGIAEELRNDPDMKRIASFVSSAYAYWFPELYSTATARITKLLKELQSKVRTFPMSVFTCVAFNFGPQVSTTLHRDWTDLAGDMCAVVALGDFDPTTGGHLVLWELRLLVEFPPGSLILFPSALISHANTPVCPGETRSSIVQYNAGPVCRDIRYLQNLLTAIRPDKGRVVNYINKLQNYESNEIVKIANCTKRRSRSTRSTTNNMLFAINVLVEHIVSIDCGLDFANQVNKPAVWSSHAKVQLNGLRIKDAIGKLIQRMPASKTISSEVIEELSWQYGLNDFYLPYKIRVRRSPVNKLAALEKTVKERSKKEVQEEAASHTINPGKSMIPNDPTSLVRPLHLNRITKEGRQAHRQGDNQEEPQDRSQALNGPDTRKSQVRGKLDESAQGPSRMNFIDVDQTDDNHPNDADDGHNQNNQYDDYQDDQDDQDNDYQDDDYRNNQDDFGDDEDEDFHEDDNNSPQDFYGDDDNNGPDDFYADDSNGPKEYEGDNMDVDNQPQDRGHDDQDEQEFDGPKVLPNKTIGRSYGNGLSGLSTVPRSGISQKLLEEREKRRLSQQEEASQEQEGPSLDKRREELDRLGSKACQRACSREVNQIDRKLHEASSQSAPSTGNPAPTDPNLDDSPSLKH
ncbi:hypothetical protein MSAN_02331600 [Mycena sanguinolenta]|uniref:Uncharacterized protein n=1 Tax=Mycena sanguinolenta TaxID=230812 RepID=A0A8H6X8B4_9AGAR|nr:hypothetical protein MSAN_02331600 [Mycena sanguinolenta]